MLIIEDLFFPHPYEKEKKKTSHIFTVLPCAILVRMYCLARGDIFAIRIAALQTNYAIENACDSRTWLILYIVYCILYRGIWKFSRWLLSKHLMWFIMLWDRLTDVKESYYIIASIFIYVQVIFSQQRIYLVLDSHYVFLQQHSKLDRKNIIPWVLQKA